MEKNFNTDNFEQLLREATDDFRMYPSKRVWHGIYNDLHPAKKWPSFAVLLLLITSIMYIGVTNPDKGNKKAEMPFAKGSQQPESTASIGTNTLVTESSSRLTVSPTRSTPAVKKAQSIHINPTNTNSSPVQNKLIAENKIDLDESKSNALTGTAQIAGNRPVVDFVTTATEIASVNTKENEKRIPVVQTEIGSSNMPSATLNRNLNVAVSPTGIFSDAGLTIATSLQTTSAKKSVNNLSATGNTDESGWMEDYALRNLKIGDKWKGRMSYQVYVTPSIGYRRMTKTTDYLLPQSNALVNNPNAPVTNNYPLNHASAINLEIGASLIYSVSKSLRLKAGAQINYTNYSINAHELNHPTFTSLMLTNSVTNMPVLSARTTTLANTQGPASKYLNNHTYQISLPIGADLKIAGKDRLKLYLGTTIQPSYVIGGQSYLISADMKNYVAEEDFMRKYNLNGAVEAFASYKTKSGVTLNIGPQFRYQFLSTYTSTFTYDERLYNLGVKVGMTKNF